MKTGLFLHIGRNKAGSTTLQSFWEERAPSLQGAGIQYLRFGAPQLAGSKFPSFVSHDQLATYLLASRGRAALVSNELIGCLSPDLSRAMAADLAEFDLRVLCYVRNYRDWVVSSYKFDVRAGLNGQDFDYYLNSIESQVSFWPQVEVWGDVLGWDRIRVRSLHPADLVGGELISDANFALGISLPMASSDSRVNVSPSWIVTELIRMLMDERNTHGWSDEELGIAQMLHHYADAAAAQLGECFSTDKSTDRYLTLWQAMMLQDKYNEDVNRVAERTGVHLQRDDMALTTGRTFLPTADRVPKRIMQAVRSLALDTEAARIHPRVATFVRKARFSQLCED